MVCTLTVVRYPKWFGWAGFLSMAIFRVPLWFNKKINFWKLMGCGKNGTFDKVPDWRQWAVLLVKSEELKVKTGQTINSSLLTINFLSSWWQFFNCETWTIVLEPIEGHGYWDGKQCFGELPKQTDYEGMIAVLTRATIRINKLKSFWENVDGVAVKMRSSDGFITSLGIGELPWIKQATFSIWQSKAHMKQFAYQLKEHAEVIRKTREDNWYSEEMFVRFRILHSSGSVQGKNPLAGKL
ncbi:MAG: spheroidene monooxygenase [Bacteroidota bacterium]